MSHYTWFGPFDTTAYDSSYRLVGFGIWFCRLGEIIQRTTVLCWTTLLLEKPLMAMRLIAAPSRNIGASAGTLPHRPCSLPG